MVKGIIALVDLICICVERLVTENGVALVNKCIHAADRFIEADERCGNE